MANVDDAISATRGYARHNHLDPEDLTGKEAIQVCDDFCRSNKDTPTSRWYKSASDNQIKLFEKKWNSWRKEQQQEKRLRERFK